MDNSGVFGQGGGEPRSRSLSLRWRLGVEGTARQLEARGERGEDVSKNVWEIGHVSPLENTTSEEDANVEVWLIASTES